MGTAPLLEDDEWTENPVGPGTNDAINSSTWRGYYDGINKRARWLRNRLDGLLGTFQLIEAVDSGTDKITITGHSIPANTVVRVASVGGTIPGGLAANVGYFAKISDADNIQLSTSSGGAAINITSSGTGTLYLYRVADGFNAFVSSAVTFAGGYALPIAVSLKGVFLYVVSVYGGTFVGPVAFSGTGAYRIDRTASLADADAAITLEDQDFRHCPDVTANRTITIDEPAARGLSCRIARTLHANAFAAVFRRAQDASIIGRLNAVGGLHLESYDSGDGLGITWHAAGMGGADQVS